MNEGFYYMANAGGRLTGTVFSDWVYQVYGLQGLLMAILLLFILIAALLSFKLHNHRCTES